MNKRKRKKMYKKLMKLSLAEKKDYLQNGKCLCFCCGQRFPLSEMREDDWLEEWDGRITALCPYCTMDTVLPDTGHIPSQWIVGARIHGFGRKNIMSGGEKNLETKRTTYHWNTIIVK